MNKLQRLEENRKKYADLKWKSSSGYRTRIVNMEDSHIVNVLKSVGQKVYLAERFPAVEEFQLYDGILYTTYADALYNEYQYRQEKMNEEFRNHVDREIYQQSLRDREYIYQYDDWGALRDTF